MIKPANCYKNSSPGLGAFDLIEMPKGITPQLRLVNTPRSTCLTRAKCVWFLEWDNTAHPRLCQLAFPCLLDGSLNCTSNKRSNRKVVGNSEVLQLVISPACISYQPREAIPSGSTNKPKIENPETMNGKDSKERIKGKSTDEYPVLLQARGKDVILICPVHLRSRPSFGLC